MGNPVTHRCGCAALSLTLSGMMGNDMMQGEGVLYYASGNEMFVGNRVFAKYCPIQRIRIFSELLIL